MSVYGFCCLTKIVVYRMIVGECSLLGRTWWLKQHYLSCCLAMDSEDTTPVIQSLRWDIMPRLVLIQGIHKICLVFYIFVTTMQQNKSENDKMLGICSEKVPRVHLTLAGPCIIIQFK